MAASEMGFSCSSPPWYPTETPHTPRRATRARWKASARTSSGSIRAFRWMPPPWRPPTYERPEHDHHARAERAVRDWVGLGST